MTETEAHDIEARHPAEPPEGRPSDIEASYSPFAREAREELKKPLDRSRVATREGRGGGRFSYLKIHDVVRTANRIFGHGNWGHMVVVQERIGEVAVTSRNNNKPGYHVAYRCVVSLHVRGCIPVSGTGYGDGVEYGGDVARLTASELALKESESDALKRALKNYGDQFGLILYADTDEQAVIEREENRDQVQWTRSDSSRPVPRNWADWVQRFGTLLGGSTPYELETAKELLREAVTLTWGVESIAGLKPDERREAFVWSSAVLLDLEETQGDLAFTPGLRDILRAAFAKFWKGIALDGPPWRLGADADEANRPTYEEWLQASASAPPTGGGEETQGETRTEPAEAQKGGE